VSECQRYVSLLAPFLDGELDAATTASCEAHLGSCTVCHERLALIQATKTSLRTVVKQAAPPQLRQRLLAALEAERAREAAAVALPRQVAAAAANAATDTSASKARRSWLSVQTILPLTAAAAVALAWQAHASAPSARARSLSDIIAEHSSPLPPDTQPDKVQGLDKFVGVPVHAPLMRSASREAHLMGARVMPVNQARGAMLQYELQDRPRATGDKPQPAVPSQRVSVFIYDPRKIQVEDADFAPRAVGSSQVRVGRTNGYSVAMTERDGVGYVVASDLDPDMNAQLISDMTP
jgi:anti-sigma factor RsiW